MLSEEELRQIAERSGKASHGPWILRPMGTIVGHRDTAAVVDGEASPGYFDWICSMQASNQPKWFDDGQFIAAARQDVPALLAMIRELQDQVKQLGTDRH